MMFSIGANLKQLSRKNLLTEAAQTRGDFLSVNTQENEE
jgi:hypothetical protein